MALPFRKLPQRKSRLTCKDITRQRIGRNNGKKVKEEGKRKTKKIYTEGVENKEFTE